MLAGEMYDPLDPELVAARADARDLCQRVNATREAPPPHEMIEPYRDLRRAHYVSQATAACS
jgi:Maltose acetyltransferase